MGAFVGSLRSNEIFSAIYNMIISQQVFADNIKGTFGDLVAMARVDGGLYGDTKLYYATDALKSAPWGNDSEAANLLNLHRPPAPSCQAIVLDTFRQISLTVDNYLTKRAWATEGAFSEFNSVMLGWIGETKKIYDSTTYNAFIGTAESSANKAVVEIPIATAITGLTGLEASRVKALTIAQGLADLLTEMEDVSRDFNDYQYLRSYSPEDLIIVWNRKFINEIRNVDLPTIFHKDGLYKDFDKYSLPERYFGEVLDATLYTNLAASTPTTAKPFDSDTGTYSPVSGNTMICRSLIEQDITVSSTTYHLFAGDELPSGAVVYASSAVKVACYVQPVVADKICVVMDKRAVPYMSAFEVGTSFVNPKSLTENHYLTWGHNKLEIIKALPFIVVTAD